MHKTFIVITTSMLLLTACSDDILAADAGDMARDSELCRAAVSEQLSRERANLIMTSDAHKMAYEQRYRFCMTDKGHTLPEVTP